jgi:hypothetical protein
MLAGFIVLTVWMALLDKRYLEPRAQRSVSGLSMVLGSRLMPVPISSFSHRLTVIHFLSSVQWARLGREPSHGGDHHAFSIGVPAALVAREDYLASLRTMTSSASQNNQRRHHLRHVLMDLDRHHRFVLPRNPSQVSTAHPTHWTRRLRCPLAARCFHARQRCGRQRDVVVVRCLSRQRVVVW